LLSNWDNVDWDGIETKALEEILSLSIHIQLSTLTVDSEVKSRDLWDVLILALSLFFLELEGDTTDRTTLNTLHQMGGVTSNLVAETLRGDTSNFTADSLVGLEVDGELGVVELNDGLGSLLDGLSTNATHDCGFLCGCRGNSLLSLGRVRTKTVKKSAKVIIERYYSKLTIDFETNKRICDEIAIIASKRLRNKIAGYTTHLMKRIQRGPVRGISFKLQEEERERKDQYVPEVSALDYTNSETGQLDVDTETKDLLKSLGFDSIPVNVVPVTQQQTIERGPRRFGDRAPRQN